MITAKTFLAQLWCPSKSEAAMGKMGELAAELEELKHCGEVLIGISETLAEMFSGADEKPAVGTKVEEKPAKKAEKKQNGKSVPGTVCTENAAP